MTLTRRLTRQAVAADEDEPHSRRLLRREGESRDGHGSEVPPLHHLLGPLLVRTSAAEFPAGERTGYVVRPDPRKGRLGRPPPLQAAPRSRWRISNASSPSPASVTLR